MTKNFQSFPGQYQLDHHRFPLGEGEVVYNRARAALCSWRQFEIGWVKLTKPAMDQPVLQTMTSPPATAGAAIATPAGQASTEVQENATVCLTVELGLLWLVFACRIIYTFENEQPEPGETSSLMRFGYAYGTLSGHPEKGEERFSVEWNRENNQVCYEIVALSQPGSLLVKVASPFARLMQARFARDSGRAMQRICKFDA